MEEHWDDVIIHVDLLGYIFEPFDENGVDLMFTNDLRKSHSKNVEDLVEKTKTCCPSNRRAKNDRTNINLKLLSLVHKFRKQFTNLQSASMVGRLARNFLHPIKPLTIFVWTDGLWQPAHNLEAEIRSTIDFLIDHQQLSNVFGIQCIYFGNDKEGSDLLEKLDKVTSETHNSNWNITDYTPAKGDVRKMLLGATNNWYDKVNERENFSSTTEQSV